MNYCHVIDTDAVQLGPLDCTGICVAALRCLEVLRPGGHCHSMSGPWLGEGAFLAYLRPVIFPSDYVHSPQPILEMVGPRGAWELTLQRSLRGFLRAGPYFCLHLGIGHCPRPTLGSGPVPRMNEYLVPSALLG